MLMVALPSKVHITLVLDQNGFPLEAMVEAGTSEIPTKRLHTDSFRVQRV